MALFLVAFHFSAEVEDMQKVPPTMSLCMKKYILIHDSQTASFLHPLHSH